MVGLPGAFFAILNLTFLRILDQLTTWTMKFNCGDCGIGSIIQSGVVMRNPGGIRIGKNVQVGRGASFGSEICGAVCVVGDNVVIGRMCRIDFTGGIEIACDVLISENAVLYTHSHGWNPRSSPLGTPLSIGEGAWIGEGARILQGVGRIGVGAIIAAGAVVTRSVDDFQIVAGVPARPIGTTR
jgi:acetyltransferase-like isoleucine patch superfamily enzyme